jgi:hypothetical protein
VKAFNPTIVTERRDVFVLDGVRFALAMEQIAHRRLSSGMRAVERSAKPSNATALRTLEAAWSICDSVHRVRGLVTQIRGLTQKDPGIQLFLRSAAAAEDARNFLQHLGSGIGKLGESSVPLVGQLRWLDKSGMTGVSLSVGHWTKGTHGLTVSIDLKTMQPAPGVWFSVAETTLDLNELHSRCRALSKQLEKWLLDTNRLSDKLTSPSVLKMRGFGRVGA